MILAENAIRKTLSGNELKKHRQKKKILNLLYHGSLSGTSISSKIGVSFPTALTLLSELTELKFVETYGTGASSGGRKPNMYRLSDNSIYVVACELGRYNAKIIIYNSHNIPVSSMSYFETSIDDNELVEKIYANTKKIIEANEINEERIYGIGLTMPGLIDENMGINHTIKNEEYRNVRERLENKFGKLIYINNDARMQAYGEYVFGKAKGHSNAVIINWNWGIGMGLILNGKLYNGFTGFAGELSHTKFVDDGDLCICGKRGCLETIASSNFLVKNAINGIKENIVSQLTVNFKDRLHELQPEDVINAAKSGDEFAISLLSKVGLALGKGLSFTIQLLNPEIIVLGGVISRANRFVLTPIQQSLNKYCLEQISSKVKIVISENWEQAGLLGVSAMLFQRLFSDTSSELKYENF
ncbi:MAG TPA: ROK family protein [Draconibacterium sp.]|nr:ROK family protein [Draconibacterium sp.]